MLNRSFAAVALAFAAAAAGNPALAAPVPRIMTSPSKNQRRRMLASFSGQSLLGTRWSRRTVAMDKRAAAKRRNQARHKAGARR